MPELAQRLEVHIHTGSTDVMIVWTGTANGETARLVLDDPDTLVYVKPILDRYRAGVELVDETGEVLAASWSALRW